MKKYFCKSPEAKVDCDENCADCQHYNGETFTSGDDILDKILNPSWKQDEKLELLSTIEKLKLKRKEINNQITFVNWQIRYIECQEIADFIEKNQNQLSTIPKNFERIIVKIRRGI